MNIFKNKIVAVLVSVILMAYVGYQVYLVIYKPYETQIVRLGTYTDDVSLNGFFIRDEQTIEENYEGVVSYRFNNAEKISKNTIVANLYKSEEDLFTLEAIKSLENKRTILERASAQNSVNQFEYILSQIKTEEIELIKRIDEGDLSQLDKISDNLLLHYNNYAVILNGTDGVKNAIESINFTINELKASLTSMPTPITVESSGYFSSYTDGLESSFTTDMLNNLTVDFIKENLKAKQQENKGVIGKVQNESNWYFVALIDTDVIDKFKENQERKLRFSSKANFVIEATIERIITDKDKPEAIVVFKSNYLDPDFATMRFEKPKVIGESYYGIKIPKQAIRFKDGKKGVYVQIGKTVRFKNVKPLYEDKDVLISGFSEDTAYVCNFDNVIIKGKELDENAM